MKLGLLNLSTGELSTVDGIESFAFSPDGAWLAMRRTPPEKKDSEKKDSADASDSDDSPGATLLLRQLSTGRDTSFGNVSEYAWQDLPKTGTLLAMTISTEDKTGNGVQVFDVRTASVRVLDTSASVYSGLSWRKKSADLAVLRSKSDDHRDGPTQVALAWIDVGQSKESAHLYEPTADPRFPAVERSWPGGARLPAGLAPVEPARGIQQERVERQAHGYAEGRSPQTGEAVRTAVR